MDLTFASGFGFTSGFGFCQEHFVFLSVGLISAIFTFRLILILSRCLQDKERTELEKVKAEKDTTFTPQTSKGVFIAARMPPVSLLDMTKLSFRPGYTQEIIRIISQNNYDINLPVSSDGLSLFMGSCLGAELELIKFLLKRGGDISQNTVDGNSALYLATFGVLNQAKQKIQENSTLGRRVGTNGRLLELLIRQGANINGRNQLGFTALHLAVAHRNVDIIKCLLRNQASPFITSKSGISPLHLAASSGFSEVVQLMQNFVAED